jgi:transposase InsO family protein
MPWKECSPMVLRREFVELARAQEANVAALCRRFGISRRVGYKWIDRFNAGGPDALCDQSRRPKCSPEIMDAALEAQVVALRLEHRSWGGRKIAKRMQVLGCHDVPSPSAITRALHRHGLIDPESSYAHRQIQRFEHAAPNDLWQMDFKGHFAMTGGGRCHPLTVLDDHSRYSITLAACDNQRTETVRGHLIKAFECYGLPRKIICDNGSPWGTMGRSIMDQWTPLTAWMLRLGIGVGHGAPYHPQTQGKDERFHRTLKGDLLKWQAINDLADAQKKFDHYRQTYNHIRPHEALAMGCPGERYKISPRSYPRVLPTVEYKAGELTRKVTATGGFTLHARYYQTGRAFAGHHVALRPTRRDGLHEVFFCHQRIGWIDEQTGESIGPRAGQSLAALAIDASAE